MGQPRTIFLYVMRETLVYCTVAFFVLTLVLLMQNLLRRLDDLFLVGMTAQDLRVVLRCVLPVVVSYALPLAFLLGTLLSIRRLALDGELGGLRACGIGPRAILIPHLILGLAATAISGWLIGSVEHQSRRELVQLFKSVAARGAILEPGKFRRFGPRLIFVEDRDRSGELRGVMISDESRPDRPYRVFAERGRFRFDETSAEIRLQLWDGDVHLDSGASHAERYQRVHFEAFSYSVDVGHILRGEFGPVRPKQMNQAELRAVLERASAGDSLRELDQRDPLVYALEIHRRRTLPWAPLLFAGIGVPIALASERHGRNIGFLACLAAAFGYYALMSVAEYMVQAAGVGAMLACWTPNVLFALAGIGLSAREQGRIPT